jgi:hypothetical protein
MFDAVKERTGSLNNVVPVCQSKFLHPVPLIDIRRVSCNLQNNRRKGDVPGLHAVTAGQFLVQMPEIDPKDRISVHVTRGPVKMAQSFLAILKRILPSP